MCTSKAWKKGRNAQEMRKWIIVQYQHLPIKFLLWIPSLKYQEKGTAMIPTRTLTHVITNK